MGPARSSPGSSLSVNTIRRSTPRADRMNVAAQAAGVESYARYELVHCGLSCLLLGTAASPPAAAEHDELTKLDPLARQRSKAATGWSRVIVQAADASGASDLETAIGETGGRPGRALRVIHGRVAEVPNGKLKALAHSRRVARISLDRPVLGSLERTAATVSATTVWQNLGLDGSGVGVAIIDSGITPQHDDLSTGGGSRVLAFADYVNGQTAPYDDYGHGTHVAGIVGGSGFDSSGARTGIAPGANLVALKVLDASGTGHISDVIAAIDYVVANKDTLGCAWSTCRSRPACTSRTTRIRSRRPRDGRWLPDSWWSHRPAMRAATRLARRCTAGSLLPATRRGCSRSVHPVTRAPAIGRTTPWRCSARAVPQRSTIRPSRISSPRASASNRSATPRARCTDLNRTTCSREPCRRPICPI